MGLLIAVGNSLAAEHSSCGTLSRGVQDLVSWQSMHRLAGHCASVLYVSQQGLMLLQRYTWLKSLVILLKYTCRRRISHAALAERNGTGIGRCVLR